MRTYMTNQHFIYVRGPYMMQTLRPQESYHIVGGPVPARGEHTERVTQSLGFGGRKFANSGYSLDTKVKNAKQLRFNIAALNYLLGSPPSPTNRPFPPRVRFNNTAPVSETQ